MAMILTRAQCFHTVARRLVMPSTRISATSFGMDSKRPASSSAGHGHHEEKEIKSIPVKVTPLEVKNPEDYNVLPDPIEHATGLEKRQLLAQLQGDDRYEAKIFHMRAGTKEEPNLVPSHLDARVVGCICAPDQQFVNYMWVRKEAPKRCSCGYWFKLVPAEHDLF